MRPTGRFHQSRGFLHMKKFRSGLVFSALAISLAACSSSSSKAEDTTTTAPAATTPTLAATTTTAPAAPAATITLSKTDGLTDGETITVSGKGFVASSRLKLGEAKIGITQCVDKGENTGADDCNLGGMAVITVNADGTAGPAEFKVAKGPFGGKNEVCGVDGPCVISLGELVPDADAQRTNAQTITFAG